MPAARRSREDGTPLHAPARCERLILFHFQPFSAQSPGASTEHNAFPSPEHLQPTTGAVPRAAANCSGYNALPAEGLTAPRLHTRAATRTVLFRGCLTKATLAGAAGTHVCATLQTAPACQGPQRFTLKGGAVTLILRVTQEDGEPPSHTSLFTRLAGTGV